MKKIDLSTIPKLPNAPVFKGLPSKLKDPSCYKDIEYKVKLAMVSDHKHTSVKSFVKCKRCLAKVENRRKILEEAGFKSYPQYLEWKKIMSIIIGQQNIVLR